MLSGILIATFFIIVGVIVFAILQKA